MTECEGIANFVIPLLFITFMLGLSYYVYVIEICLKIPSQEKRYAYLGIYHLLKFMFCWCFCKVILTEAATVPNHFSIPSDLFERILNETSNELRHRMLLEYCESKQITVVMRTSGGFIRFCMICKHIKPDRSHHCSNCKKCILKMDHHCVWVNNCVCLTNYKSFVLALFYISLFLIFCFGTSAEFFWDSISKFEKTFRDMEIMFIFLLFFVMGTILICFFLFHLMLLITNTTTIEKLSVPIFAESNEGMSFNVGFCNNIMEVFGHNFLCCCCPVENSRCDGVNFPMAYVKRL